MHMTVQLLNNRLNYKEKNWEKVKALIRQIIKANNFLE